jgi:gentisate 1,2-dioxygenase
MHRLASGAATLTTREAGSSVWQVFAGRGSARLDGQSREITRGDVIAVPSWCEVRMSADVELTLFRMSDAPIFERLNLDRKVTS